MSYGLEEEFGLAIVVGSARKYFGLTRAQYNRRTYLKFLDWQENTEAGRAYRQAAMNDCVERERMARGEIKVLSGDLV